MDAFVSHLKLSELLEKIGEVIEIKLREALPVTDDNVQQKYISRQQAADLLKISLPTLGEYTKLNWLQSYKIGNRVLYKFDEVEQSIDKLATYKNKRL